MTRDLILGTAGHIDHGKTSLVKALTGIDCDRLPEEKARGITMHTGLATLQLPPFRLGIVAVPGHERFVKNMLAGATGIDWPCSWWRPTTRSCRRRASTWRSCACWACATASSP